MRQFDVCRIRDRGNQLVVVLQHDAIDELSTRIVAPLSDKPYKRMIADVRVPIDFDGAPFVLQLDRLAAIEKSSIGMTLGRIEVEQQRIKNALDLLVFGV